VSTIEFAPFPKIPRLNRGIVITEKIDGTNAAVVIVPLADFPLRDQRADESFNEWWLETFGPDSVAIAGSHIVFAQSRKRFVTPGKGTDNYGFAGWVQANAEALVDVLGAGTHYGEWWGAGIQCGYGLTGGDKRFSLFNTSRWGQGAGLDVVPGLGVVPVLYEGIFDQEAIEGLVTILRHGGSAAAPGYMKPEGVVIFSEASRTLQKVTLEGDEAPKGAAGHARDEEKVAA